MMIHPTSVVSAKAKIGENVKIGPYSVISDNVEIGNNVEIASHVVIDNGARIANDCKIFSGAVISTAPQDLKYNDEETLVFIGERTVVREYATINRGTKATGKTVVGADCLIMTYCHVAHDCRLGDNVIMSNLSQIAGHVALQDWVILGGMAKITQFCTVGKHSMIGADVKIVKDVAPYNLVGRIPAKVEGINKIGLKRRGFTKECIDDIERFYDTLLFSGLNTTDGIARFQELNSNIIPEVQEVIDFIVNSSRGIHR